MAGNEIVKLRGSIYYENFTVKGRRFRGSLGTDHYDTAVIIATKRKSDALLGKLTDNKPEMTLDNAWGKYYLEVACYKPSAETVENTGIIFRRALGKDTLLSDLTTAMIADYAARRKLGKITHRPDSPRQNIRIANSTVNNDLRYLRALLNRADDVWEVAVPKIKWKKVFLPEASERQHILGRAVNQGCSVL